MTNKKFLVGILSILLVFSFVLVGCNNGGDSPEEELNSDVTSKVIGEMANQAGLYFMATPDTAAYSQQQQTAKNAGFTWATDLVIEDASTSEFISGKSNQLTAEGSGFCFRLKTSAPPGNLRAAIGFSGTFTFTADADNIGTDAYNALTAAIKDLPQFEGWVMPESSDILTTNGIKIYTTYSGVAKDITDRISFGIMPTDEGLFFMYGAVVVDRAINDFAKEGSPLFVSDEKEFIWSDGAADNDITAEWWIGKQP